MRWVKLIQYDQAKVKVSLDFMEGEIRGRKAEEVILIDDAMIQNSKLVTLSIAGEDVDVLVPNYLDYLIMKVVSLRASDIRDIASLVHENGVPYGLDKRVRQILPHPRIFRTNVEQVLIPEIRKATFLDSWRGIFATTSYAEEDKKEVVELSGKIMKL